MVRSSLAAGVALLATWTVIAQSPPPAGTAGPDLTGKLYKSVFFSGPGALVAADLASLPADVRARLDRYLTRRGAFESRLRNGASSFESVRSEARKRIIERAIVALVEAPGIEQAAAAYAESAHVLTDWQKDPQAPLAEAAAAEEFLKKDPSIAMAPFLYVFIAERQRAGFELMNVALHKADMNAAAKKYRTFMQRARAAEDSIFRLLADDMDRQPFLYARSEFHPRDFDPDS